MILVWCDCTEFVGWHAFEWYGFAILTPLVVRVGQSPFELTSAVSCIVVERPDLIVMGRFSRCSYVLKLSWIVIEFKSWISRQILIYSIFSFAIQRLILAILFQLIDCRSGWNGINFKSTAWVKLVLSAKCLWTEAV